MLQPALKRLFKIREDAGKRHHRPGADDGFDPYEKPFLDHLEDLRITLMKMIGALLVTTVLTFVFNKQIFEFIQYPAKLAKFDDGSTLFERAQFVGLSPQEFFVLAIKAAFYAGIILAFPLLVYFAGEFIMPGLKQEEKRYIIPGIGVGFFLFLVGASFSFFAVIPIALKFFYAFQLERTQTATASQVEERKYIPVLRDWTEVPTTTLEEATKVITGEEPADKDNATTGDAKEEGNDKVEEAPTNAPAPENAPGPKVEETPAKAPPAAVPAPKPETVPDPDSANAPDSVPVATPKPTATPEPAAAPEPAPAPETTPGPEPAETQAKPKELEPAMKSAVREYLLDFLVIEEGTDIKLKYDQQQDKLVLTQLAGIQYRIGDYLGFVTQLTIVFGLAFQMPLVVMILSKLEMLTARTMRATRSYAWIIIIIFSAVVTPPDALTLGLLAAPMIFLYELCIWIAWMIERSREKQEAEEEAARKERLRLLYDKRRDDLSEDEKEELHRHEIEQYEREHAHLYEDENEHEDMDDESGDTGPSGSIGAHDPYHDHDHDESWYDEDHHHWHEEDHYKDQHPHGETDEHHEDTEEGEVQDRDETKQNPDAPGGAYIEGTVPREPGSAKSASPEPGDAEAAEPPGEEESSSTSFKEETEEELPLDYCQASGPIVNVNTATEEELQTLAGIGPSMARNIIAARPYNSFDDLLKVPGITDDKLNALIDRLSVEPPDEYED